MLSAEQAVMSELSSILSRRGDVPAIEAASLLHDELGLTSLNLIELLMNVCEVMGMDVTELTDVDFTRVNSVADVVDLVSRAKSSVRSMPG
jgi:acyl carrier protein